MLNKIARLMGTGKQTNDTGKEVTLLSYPWATLRFQHVEAIKGKLAESYRPATVNKALTAMRGVLRAAWLLGQVTLEDYNQARAVKGMRIKDQPASRVLTTGEIAALVSVCKNDPTPAGVRDMAIIDITFTVGLQRSELVRLDMADYDPGTRKLTVRGNEGKDRSFYLIDGAARALSAWLALRGKQSGALFRPIKRGGRILSRHLSSQAIYDLLMKRGKEAGLKGFTPTGLRRAFINNRLED
jgi:integrase